MATLPEIDTGGMFVEFLQLEMPDSFPVEAYRLFMETCRSVLLHPKGAEWTEFAGASNLIAWRFRAAWEDQIAYWESWRRDGVHTSFEELYRRERWLYGMFSSGVSCLESTSYAIYAFASHNSVLGLTFGHTERLKADLPGLHRAVRESKPDSALVGVLDDILDDPVWLTWRQFRNRMTHRGNIPRVIKGSMGGAAPPGFTLELAATSSSPAVQANEAGFQTLFDWLPVSLGALLNAGASLR